MIVHTRNCSEIILRETQQAHREDNQMTKTVKKPNLAVAVITPKKAGTFIRPGMHYRPE